MNAYQAFSQRLFALADMQGLPLSGTFELTPRCNFRCKMCYIHRTETDALARAQELSAARWLALAEECCRAGTLLLLLTGGEPLLRPDFREIYTGCKRLGLMLSLNTNASLMDDAMTDFLAANPPARVNITLYGADSQTYGTLCGVPDAYDRVIAGILRLKEAGILVKLNVSVTPWNRHDAQRIYAFAAEHQIGFQAASYMFPPVRACEHGSFCSERLTPEQAAAEKVRYECAHYPEAVRTARWKGLLAGEAVPDPDAECQELPTQKLRCRAGSSTFWVTWDGQLRPCGMMTEPGVCLNGRSFADAWQEIHHLRDEILVPAKCSACTAGNACDQCAAACFAETGRYTGVPEYMCRMTGEYLRLIAEAVNDPVFVQNLQNSPD